MRRWCYHPDTEKLRELLSKVTDEQKLNILQQTKSRRSCMTALHVAAYRDDAKMINTILSSLQCSDRLKLLMMENYEKRIPLHIAAQRGHTESVKAILSSLQSSDRLKPLMMKNRIKRTPLHTAASEDHTKSVKAILDSLTADQQMQLLIEEDLVGETAVEMASGETADVLIRYSMNAIRETRKGKICHPLTCAYVHLCWKCDIDISKYMGY